MLSCSFLSHVLIHINNSQMPWKSHGSKSASFSYTCHDFQVPGCVEFEESAPFSYMCHNFQIPECVGFEESVPFSYTCRDFDDELRFGSTSAYVYPASPKLSICVEIHIIAYI